MKELLTNEEINFKIINFLQSALQGKFAYLNILNQARHQMFNPEEFNTLKDNLKKVALLVSKYDQGIVIININNKINSEDEKFIFSLLQQIEGEFLSIGKKIIQKLSENLWQTNQQDSALLVAYYGYHSYIEENFYKKKLIHLQKQQNQERIVEAEYLLKDSTDSVELTGNFLNSIKNFENIEKGFFAHLGFFIGQQPGYFLSKAHSANILKNIKTKSLSYSDLKLDDAEANEWQDANLDPEQAGFWIAYNFQAFEAKEWISYGLVKARNAFEWKFAKFSPRESITWINFFFTPLLAIQWSNAKFNAEQSAFLITKGFSSPKELPTSKEEILKIFQSAKKGD